MSPALLLVTLTVGYINLVEVHGPSGQRYYINPQEITTVREPIGNDLRFISPGTHCVIFMVNGKFIPVHETCDRVKALVAHAPLDPPQ